MASDGGGVPNSKQHARTKKPYDRRTSIVKRMRETMKDMMSPSWLVDLVHSVRKQPQPSHTAQTMNNVSQPAPASRNQTVCSEVRNTHTAFVPINQAAASSSEVSSSRAATYTSNSPQFSHFATMPLQGQSTCMSGQTVYSKAPVYTQPPTEYSQETNNYMQPKGDDQSEVSEYSISTSGCSSLVPHPDQRDYQRDILQLSESKIVQMRQELGGSVTPSKEIDPPMQCHSSVSDGRNVSKLSTSNNNKSFLWSSSARPSRPSRPQPPAKSQRPSFNVSIFGSPIQSASTRRHELGKDYQQSPYYPGKTTFGGAASHRKNRLQHSSPYHSPLTKRQVTARPLNNSTLGGVTSSTAKRILDTLEKMSTPIKDAKKIPSYNSSLVDSTLSFTPGNYRRRSLPIHRQDTRSTAQMPPVAGIAPPTMAPVMRNLQGLTTRESAPQLPQSSPARSTAPVRGTEAQRDGGARTGKMRRERQHYSSKKVSQDEEVELPALQTSFTLPIGSMPTITFGSSITPGSDTTPSTRPSRLSAVSDTGSPPFKFSSPIQKEGGNILGGGSSPTSPRSFQFSSPISVSKAATVINATQSPHTTPFSAAPSCSNTLFNSSPSLAFNYQVDSAKLKKKLPPSPASSPEPGGFSPAKQLAAGSVMDFLSKSASDHGTKSNKQAAGDLSSLFKKPAGSWDCPTCFIQNKEEVNKCVACCTSKPCSTTTSDSAVKQPLAPSSQSLGSLFKAPAGSWECPTCMIQNKADVAKCVACETTRPKANNSQVAAPASIEVPTPVGGNNLAAMFKKPAGSWECPTCMVQNGATHDLCPACNTARPGTATTSAEEPVQLPPLTGPSLASQFAKPAGSWECDTCMVTNKDKSNKCIACETPRPGTKSITNFTSPGGFKFGTTGGLVLTSTTTTSDSTGGAPVFSFGSSFPTSKPAETTDKPLDGGFKFGQGASMTNFDTSGGLKFGESSVSASGSTGFKLSDSSSNVLPTKPLEDAASTPFGGVQFEQSKAQSVGSSNSSQFVAEPAGGFKFGATATAPSGATAKTSEPAPPTTSSTTSLFDQTGTSISHGSSGVKFGKTASDTGEATDVTTTAPSFGGFSATTTDSASGGTQKKQPSAGGFSFGQPVSVTPDVGSNTTTVPKKGGFQFGASATTFTNPASVNPTSGVKLGGFSFGGSTKTSDTKSQSSSVAGGFSFGGSTKTSDTKSQSSSAAGGFSFGGSTKPSETKTVSSNSTVGGFSFGAHTKASNTKTESGGAASGGFNFGGNAKTSQATAVPENSTVASTDDMFKFGGSGTSSAQNSPMVMTPGTPVVGGFNFPAAQIAATAQSTDQNKSIFGSASTSKTGGFTFGATSVSSSGAATSKPLGGVDTGFGFRKRANDADDNPVKRNKGFGAEGFAFGGANTTTSTSASSSLFGAGASGFGTAPPAFGSPAPNTAASTFNPPAFGATMSVAPAAGSVFAAASAPPGGAFGAAATKSTFQFGATAAATTTSMFSFGGSQPAQSTSAPKPSGGFPFGGQSQPTALGVGAPAPQQPTPGFNFNSTPNMNFGASQLSSQTAPFQFGGHSGVTPGTNSFSINRAPASGSMSKRVIKRAVRKVKK